MNIARIKRDCIDLLLEVCGVEAVTLHYSDGSYATHKKHKSK